jgi:serine/threonine protein phosphatase PrpC
MMIRERLRAAYREHIWVKALTLLGLLLCATFVIMCSGGFPPWAWQFLFSVVIHFPALWHQQGSALLLPLLGLCLLSLSLLIIWVVLVTLGLYVVIHSLRDFSARQNFLQDLEEAERLAAQQMMQSSSQPQQQVVPNQAQVQVQAGQAAERRAVQEASPLLQVQDTSVVPVPSVSRSHSIAQAHAVGDVRGAPVGRAMPGHAPQRSASIPSRPSQTSVSQQVPRITTRRLHIVPPPPIHDDIQINDHDEEELEQAFERMLERDAIAEQTTRPDRSSEHEFEDDEQQEEAITQERERKGRWSRSGTQPLRKPRLETMAEPAPEPEPTPTSEEDEITLRRKPMPSAEPNVLLPDHPALVQNAVRLIAGIGIDPGLKRKNAPNEDSIFAIQGMRVTDDGTLPAGLFIVADGMGGHVNGREASRTAVHTTSDVIVPALLRDVTGQSLAETESLFRDMVRDGVHRANLALYRRNREQQTMMGTTITMALVVNTTAFVANVGDSRTYRYRPSEGLVQITNDHSVVARLVENGLITPDEIYTHPRRNQIYRCLGEHASADLDLFIVTLEPGDTLLLCSDGLWEMVRDPDIEQLVAELNDTPDQLCAELVQAALDGGGADNVSVVAVSVANAYE